MCRSYERVSDIVSLYMKREEFTNKSSHTSERNERERPRHAVVRACAGARRREHAGVGQREREKSRRGVGGWQHDTQEDWDAPHTMLGSAARGAHHVMPSTWCTSDTKKI